MTAQAKAPGQAAFEKRSGQEPIAYYLEANEANTLQRVELARDGKAPPDYTEDEIHLLDDIEIGVMAVARRLRRPISARYNGVEFFQVSKDGEVKP